MAQLGRDAICFYLDHVDVQEINEREALVEKRIRDMEHRIAKMIAQTQVDVGVLLSLMYGDMNAETREEEIKEANYNALVRFRRKLAGPPIWENLPDSRPYPSSG